MASANAGVGVRAHRISDGPNPHQQQYVSVLPSSSAAGPATAVPIFAVSGSSGRPTLRQRSYTNPSFSTSSVSASTLPSVSHHYAGSAATLAAEAAAKAQQQAAQTQAPPVNSYGGGFQSFGNASPTGAVPPSPIGSRRPSAAQFSTYSTTTSVTSPISSRPPQIPLPAGLSAVNRSPSSPSLASVARQQQFLTLQPQPPLHQKPQPPPPPPPPPPPHLAPSSTDERSNARDSILSIASIVNDPFFQRYHGAEAVAAEQRFQQQLELDSSPGLELRRQRSQAALPPTPFSPPGGSTKPTAASAAQTPLQQAQQQLPPTPPPKEPLPPPPPAKQQLPPLPLQQPPPPPQQQLPPLPPNPRQMSMSSGAAQRHERKPQVPTLNPRRDSLPARDSHIWQPNPSPTGMDTINIVAVGASGIGKSSLLQRLFGLPPLPGRNIVNGAYSVDNVPYFVTVIEIDLEDFPIDAGQQPFQWPKQIDGYVIPRVDGALVMYDVSNKESTANLAAAITAFANLGLPTALVACKCDSPESAREVSPSSMAAAFTSVIGSFKTSMTQPESAKACLTAVCRGVISLRRAAGESSDPGGALRRRAASAINLDTPPDSATSRPLSQQSKHSRASSDLSLLRGFPAPPGMDYYRGQPGRSPRVDPNSPGFTSSFTFTDDTSAQTVSSMLRTPGGVRLDSFLDVEESDAESYRHSDDIPILQRNDDSYPDGSAKQVGVTFEDLVDRLLAPKMSRADSNYTDIFLCLYRQFAAPGELFGAILAHLDKARDDQSLHYLQRTAIQLRIIEVVAKWVATYPGDFARRPTRKKLEQFVQRLSAEPIFSTAAHEMRRHLERNVVEDDDTGWARSDEVEEDSPLTRMAGKDPFKGSEMTASFSTLHLDDIGGAERRPSTNSELSSAERDGSSATASGQFQFHTYDDYAREAATLDPTQTLPLTKARYHLFMDTPHDEIAEEMTRIDWVMFSSIRMRDLVRHVSLSPEEKNKCRSLDNINRMVDHFNHVAKWVANMILMRDKAKHRAQMLEKFMHVALKLRLLNNYNGLAAVLAGINGSAIHRLTQTRALVPQDVARRFARLVILMGTQKSYFSYRLAWENSPLPRIPFMPLHRRDLVSAEEGSRTLVGPNGDRINWKKFEVLGEVLLPVMRSQGTPYSNLAHSETAREFILHCKMPTDDEEIYQRSLQVESASGSAAEGGKKKFPWFAK